MEKFYSGILLHEIVFIAFCFVALIQLFYYLRFFRLLAFYKPAKKEKSQQHPVSVIICARDDAGKLAVNLPGALVQNYPSTFEVLVVNHNSQDDTRFLLDEFKKSYKGLHIVNLEHEAIGIPGKKYPLSMGIKEAKHEIVLLTDADCVPASEFWIEKMQGGYDDGIKIVLGYGAYHKKPGALNKMIRFETFHSALQYLSFALGKMPYMGVGRNLSYKKELFFNNKGFSSINHLPGGDDDLFINMVADNENTNVVIDPGSFTLSEPKRSFSDWVYQKNRHYTTSKFYKPKTKWLVGAYTISHFLFYPLFIASLVLFSWQFSLAIFILRLGLQALIFYKAMDRLNEKDLFAWWWLLDIWMFFYYLIFLPSLWRKPRKNWR
ncbi:MAG: glycosyltransferase [Bacteroidetes bacterium]|nr:glycosyltransferase [Bacteroidota bacterium]